MPEEQVLLTRLCVKHTAELTSLSQDSVAKMQTSLLFQRKINHQMNKHKKKLSKYKLSVLLRNNSERTK